MSHNKLALTCDKCGLTKAGRFFKRLHGFKGYYPTCRECTEDGLKKKVCITCGEKKSELLGFTKLGGDGPRSFSDDCRECRKLGKEKVMPSDDVVRTKEQQRYREYYWNVARPKNLAKKRAEATTSKPPVEWPWKLYEGPKDDIPP